MRGGAGVDKLKDVKRANFRLIEKELYCYEPTKADYERAREDIFNKTVTPEVPVYTGPGDPTVFRAMALQSSVLIETGRRLAAIEHALEVIKKEPAREKLVRLKYFEGRLTDEGIMSELHLPERTFRRWRREFVSLIAARLGWEI